MAVNIVLISTYELGRQPFGLASPAAWLRKRGQRVVALGLSTILGGEFEEALVQLAERLAMDGARASAQPAESLISMARLQFEVPDRTGMPAMEKYAHLIVPGDGYRIVGSTEASRGCKHLCRHCPIVPVYKGVFRI